MSLQLIEGGAGTGKTTMVIDRLGHLLNASPLAEHQRVLALTKMHGSRRRVRERLMGVSGYMADLSQLRSTAFQLESCTVGDRLPVCWLDQKFLLNLMLSASLPVSCWRLIIFRSGLRRLFRLLLWMSFRIVGVDNFAFSRAYALSVNASLPVMRFSISMPMGMRKYRLGKRQGITHGS